MTTPSELLTRLDALRPLDPEMDFFGSSKHRYELAPPLPEAEIVAFETAYRLRLPAEYRSFLLEAGSSGAGPEYGLAPLAPWTPDSFAQVYTRITDASGAVVAEAGTGPRPGLSRQADPARPFPLTGPWSPPAEGSENVEGAFPADANPFDGCTYLAEIGCGYCSFLVLTGEHAGEVWQDYTAGGGAIAPTGKGFFAWYDDWLDHATAKCAADAMVMALRRSEEPTPDLSRHATLLRDIAARAPDGAIDRLRVGIACAYEGRYADAEAEFARAVELEPELELDVAVARCASLWRQDEIDQVAEVARKGIASNQYSYPKKRELHEVRVLALRLSGRFDEAIAASEDRILFEPDALPAWLDKAYLEVLNGDSTVAEATIRKAASQDGEPDQATLCGGFRALARRLAGSPDDAPEAARFEALAEALAETNAD